MDLVDRAINASRHINNIESLSGQTWDSFFECCIGRSLILYGAGPAIVALACEYPWLEVTMIIDGDEGKHGMTPGQLYPVIGGVDFSRAEIAPPSVLDQEDLENRVILLTGMRAYEETYRYCRDIGFRHIYSFLCMEEKKRNRNGWKEFNLDRYQNIFSSWCITLPIEKNKIVFQMFGTYSDHGKYITEELIKLGCGYDIVWIFNRIPDDLPAGIRPVSMEDWTLLFREYETAACWIINTIMPPNIIKRPGQTYIHTKHWASVTLKRFYLDAPTLLSNPQLKTDWENEFHRIDYMISGSDFDEESCRRGFDFHGEFIRAGSPRSDAMFRTQECRSKVYSHYGVSEEVKTILYAPTYRYNAEKPEDLLYENRSLMIDYDKVRDILLKRFGGRWIILRRLHPALIKYSEDEKLPEDTIDVTLYEDGEELCAACDVIISDYSSIMFEPAFAGKPVFLYAPDRDEYIGKEYDLLLDYDSLPFPISLTNEELVRNIESFNEEKYQTAVNAFLEKYGVKEDGHASKRAAQAIIDIVEQK